MNKNISSYYPPSRYVFYPIYKFCRKKLGLNQYTSNMATWGTSAIFHSLLGFKNQSYVEAVVYGAPFLILGALSTGIKYYESTIRSRIKEENLEKIVN